MNRILVNEAAGGGFSEAEAELACRSAESYILSYCGLESVPKQLESVARSMAAELLKNGQSGVETVKVGDTSVSFGGKSPLTAYNRLLNRYRKLRWTVDD